MEDKRRMDAGADRRDSGGQERLGGFQTGVRKNAQSYYLTLRRSSAPWLAEAMTQDKENPRADLRGSPGELRDLNVENFRSASASVDW